MSPVTVLGATGAVGRLVVERLLAQGRAVIAPVRHPPAATSPDGRIEYRSADYDDASALRAALHDARIVLGCAHARFAPAAIAALPGRRLDRLVWIGSTRRFTRYLDRAAAQVMAAERAMTASPHPGVMLHPTMIYGDWGHDNVGRIAALIRRFGFVPLPGGGRSLIQPISAEDVAACVLAAMERPEAVGPPIVVAGPRAMTYREFVAAIAAALGRRAAVLPLPASLLTAVAALTRFLPLVPRFQPDEVRRLNEDKAFSIGAMRHRLGIEPIPLEKGLARMFRGERPAARPR